MSAKNALYNLKKTKYQALARNVYFLAFHIMAQCVQYYGMSYYNVTGMSGESSRNIRSPPPSPPKKKNVSIISDELQHKVPKFGSLSAAAHFYLCVKFSGNHYARL